MSVQQSARLETAIAEWRRVPGPTKVLAAAEADARFGAGTTNHSRVIAGAVAPNSAEEVAATIDVARAEHVPLYPISTGLNWGYGDARPAVDDCVLVDLSGMNKSWTSTRNWGSSPSSQG